MQQPRKQQSSLHAFGAPGLSTEPGLWGLLERPTDHPNLWKENVPEDRHHCRKKSSSGPAVLKLIVAGDTPAAGPDRTGRNNREEMVSVIMAPKFQYREEYILDYHMDVFTEFLS